MTILNVGVWIENKSRLLKVASNLSLRLLSAFIGVSAQFVMGYMVSPAQYGQYLIVVTVCNLMLIFSKWGLDTLIIKEISKEFISHKVSLLQHKTSVIYFSLLIVFCSSVLFMLVLYLVKDSGLFSFYWLSGVNEKIFLLISCFLGLSAMGLSLLRGQSKPVTADLIENIIRPVFFIAVAFAFYCWSGINAQNLAVIYMLSFMVIFLCCITLSTPLLHPVNISFAYIGSQKGHWLNQALFINITAIISFAYFQLDTLLVAKFLGNESAGVYGMVCNFTRFVTMLATILSLQFQPIFVRLSERANHVELFSVLKKCLLVSYLFSLAAFIALVIAGRFVLHLINPAYVIGYPALVMVSFAHTFNALAIVLIAFGNVVNLHKKVMVYYVLGALVTTGLDLILIQKMNLIGAGLSLALGLLFFNVFISIAIFKKMKSERHNEIK
ncbi:oligosaccharide flippase family protein [Pectobacteriaceae bacterium CE70]|nr:oligosaccharide flippase family protein [Pectobacteriaceae bacterium C52]WJV65701.1 oligosaccharide flippase family protein [Pectobacteriaceae bacterium CE70]WJY09720.1 oligosaccharide flippase family protein [Pectobacteriaceae bacterium C80]